MLSDDWKEVKSFCDKDREDYDVASFARRELPKAVNEIDKLDNRIRDALEIATSYGSIDGDHHKMWTIDQMVRALTGCPKETKTANDYKGVEYTYEDFVESEEYKQFIKNHNNGDDGPDTYEWDVGIPP